MSYKVNFPLAILVLSIRKNSLIQIQKIRPLKKNSVLSLFARFRIFSDSWIRLEPMRILDPDYDIMRMICIAGCM